jgi:signal transduction histidine kinase
VSGLDLRPVADALAAARDEILERWLESTAEQTFHAGRRAGAVADHIPRLFDALVSVLERTSTHSVDAASPLDDPDVLTSAEDHARARFEQGLQPADVVTEFRLLRQEVGRALWTHLGDETPAATVAAAELVVHDALDGAITLALHALTTHIEEVREDFLATTLHDTRQPLTSIKGFHQLIVRALNQPNIDRDRLREHLRRATAEVDRMSALLDTLTDVSRVALGRLTLRVIAVDMADLLRTAADRLPPELRQRIRMDLAADGRGEWDPAMLDRVVGNLLSNALKFSPEDAPIDVILATEPRGVQVIVRDYGIGLEPQDLVQLFRRYARGRGATERGIEGLGLGLYLSYGIVEAHGGKLRAESAGRGRGTTMYMDLPRSVPPPHTPSST